MSRKRREEQEAVEGGPYQRVALQAGGFEIECRYYRAPGSRRGVAWVGGVGGDWDTPADRLYPKLCTQLQNEGISSVRVHYRDPLDLPSAVLDLLEGIRFLKKEGARSIGLVGHSLGGAVVIQAAAREQAIHTVVTLATQSYGAEAASHLAPRCSMLIVHGTADRVLPWSASEYVYRLAGEPKRLLLIAGAGHLLEEAGDEVERQVKAWLIGQLHT